MCAGADVPSKIHLLFKGITQFLSDLVVTKFSATNRTISTMVTFGACGLQVFCSLKGSSWQENLGILPQHVDAGVLFWNVLTQVLGNTLENSVGTPRMPHFKP